MEINTNTPWSAAFISYVVRTALGPSKFPGRNSHAAYSDEIRKNPGKYPFDVLDPFSRNTYPLQVGDIIVYNRGGTELLFNSPTWNTGNAETHGDIVVSAEKNTLPLGTQKYVYKAVGGNLSDTVRYTARPLPSPFTLNHDRNEFQTLGREYFVVLRPKKTSAFDLGASESGKKIARIAMGELRKWQTQGWKDSDPRAFTTLQGYWGLAGEILKGSSLIGNITTESIPSPPVPTESSAISPYITDTQSFHPNIQYELTRRRLSAETANAYMPFVKLTSLLRIDSSNLPDGTGKAWCPTLGIHGEKSVTFESLYVPQGNRSIVAYANTSRGRAPVIVDKTATETDQSNIPSPGILSVSTEKSTAGPMGVRGGLFRSNIKILAYSTGQVDALLKYFLRPATRVVLEFGRVSSDTDEPTITPFSWHTKNEDAIKKEIEEFIFPAKNSENRESPQQKFIREKVYNNFGNYEIYIGYVVNFKLKYNKNNQFEIDLTVHSVQQYEIPTRLSGTKALCKSPAEQCKNIDVTSYFDESQSWRPNSFAKLIEQVLTENASLSQWSSHVIQLKDSLSNSAVGTRPSGVNNRNVMGNNNGFLVSWRFFIEVLLNHPNYGIVSVFPNDSSRKYAKLGLISPSVEADVCDNTKLVANEVGYHPSLRSTNPSVMVIYNETAQNEEAAITFNRVKVLAQNEQIAIDLTPGPLEQKIKNNGSFKNICGKQNESGVGSLMNGVWLNTKAIINVFSRVDTISAGLNALLVELNNATQGYWNLQLLSNDNNNPGLHVIDMGLSKSINQVEMPANVLKLSPESSLTNRENAIGQDFGDPVKGTPKFLYVFNRKTTTLTDDALGSELLDVNIEFNLPQVIAVQAIAGIGGVSQRSSLNSINIPELEKLSILDSYSKCVEPTCKDDSPVNICAGDPVLSVAGSIRDFNLAPADATSTAATVARGQQFTDQAVTNQLVEEIKRSNPNFINSVREYSNYGMALQFIEFNTGTLVNKLTKSSQGCNDTRSASPNAFNSSNLTKTIVDLTMPGIGGIQLFQAFLVDRVPSILKRGYYIVTKINHEFTPANGWITKIQGRFRYAPQAGDPQ